MQASVAAALSRDVVFGRPAPATYCLASFLTAAALYAPPCSCIVPVAALHIVYCTVLQASLCAVLLDGLKTDPPAHDRDAQEG